MFLYFLFYVFFTLLLSQTLKYFIKFGIQERSFQNLKSTLLFLSGMPSSHTAILAMTMLFLKNHVSINDPVFLIFFVFAFMWLFEIYMQRKRHNSLKKILSFRDTEEDEWDLIKELNGHDFVDILVGVAVGFASYEFLTWILS